jgi:hypothetical protein
MANAAERGGGTRTSPADALAKQRAMERQSFTYTPPRPKKTTPKKVVARKRQAASSGSRRSSSVERRISRSSNSGNTRRTGSSGSRNRRSAPVSPPKSNTKKIVPPAPPKPVVPSGKDWLRSDSTYQRQLAAYAKALADFQADQGLARSDYETGYQQTYRDIGLAKADASEDLENDYAARGLLKSSLYNTALGDLNQQYQNQYNDLGKQRTAFLDQLGQELSKYSNEQAVQKQNALQESVRRRAEKYNL